MQHDFSSESKILKLFNKIHFKSVKLAEINANNNVCETFSTNRDIATRKRKNLNGTAKNTSVEKAEEKREG